MDQNTLLAQRARGHTVKKRWRQASAHSQIMVPGVMMFLSLPFPILIMAFFIGHIDIDAMLCQFMSTNDPSCYVTVMELAVIQSNVLLWCFMSASYYVDQNNCIITLKLRSVALSAHYWTSCTQCYHTANQQAKVQRFYLHRLKSDHDSQMLLWFSISGAIIELL